LFPTTTPFNFFGDNFVKISPLSFSSVITMTSYSFVVVILLALCCLQVSSQTLCVPADGGNATSVLGQSTFTNGTQGGLGLFSFANPNSVVVDPTTQKVFVADGNNNRILRFTSANALLTNGSAELVVFGNSTGGCSPETLNYPEQIDLLSDWLFVGDSSNFRVLKLTGITTTNATITTVTTTFGQLNSSTCTYAGAAQTLNDINYPTGVAITNNGSLFASDGDGSASVNCFIRRFDSATNTTDYPTPNSLLGDGTCTASNASVSNGVYYLYVDKTNGHLFAADYNFGRVSLFKTAHLRANASGVIDTFFGQTNSTAYNVTCDNINLNGPYGVHFDTAASVLIVSDQNTDRVVFFNNPLLASTGAVINNVLGTNDTFACGTSGATESTFNSPQGLFYSSEFPGIFLMVADNGASRVMRFECTNATFSMSITMSNTSAPSSPGTSTGIPSSSGLIPSSSGLIPSSSGLIPSSSGVVPSSVVVASSSGVAPSSVVVASSSGGAPSSSGVVPSSSGGAPSSSGVPPSQSDTPSGAALSLTGSGTPSQSSTPSNSLPPQSESNTPIIPPVAGTNGVAAAVCGNGVVEKSEECDAGAAVPRTKCCSPFCTNLRAGAVCGKATTKCTKRPKCRTSLASRQLVCQPGQPKQVGTKCGKGGIFSRKTCKADGSCSK
jgi:hypothetical protein